MRYEPCGRRVLVRVIDGDAGGLVAGDGTSLRKADSLEVIAVGHDVHPQACKPGDRVFIESGAKRMIIPGEKGVFLVTQDDIALKVYETEPAQDSTVGAMH